LVTRLRMDIEGVLKTCVAQGVHTLVSGASGCGAFCHDPEREAALWHECLLQPDYRGSSLRKVVFAVLDKEDSDNWRAFAQQFGRSEK